MLFRSYKRNTTPRWNAAKVENILEKDPTYYLRIRKNASLFLDKAIEELETFNVDFYLDILEKTLWLRLSEENINSVKDVETCPEPRLVANSPEEIKSKLYERANMIRDVYVPKVVASLKKHRDEEGVTDELIMKGLQFGKLLRDESILSGTRTLDSEEKIREILSN